MFELFTPGYSIEDFAHLGASVGRDDDINVIADRFRCGKSIQPFGRPVPAGDVAVKRFCDDGIIGRFHHRAEQALALDVAIPFRGGLPSQRYEQARQLRLQADIVDQQHRQNETCRTESVDPADIKSQIESRHVDDR